VCVCVRVCAQSVCMTKLATHCCACAPRPTPCWGAPWTLVATCDQPSTHTTPQAAGPAGAGLQPRRVRPPALVPPAGLPGRCCAVAAVCRARVQRIWGR
jgi:hypothetical protein